MNGLWDVPSPPDWAIDWNAIEAVCPWTAEMQACQQDPKHHPEGDAWTHTRLVCEALVASEQFRCEPEAERLILFYAAVLHDVGKPPCTKVDEEGRLHAYGHERVSATRSRRLLWEAGVPFETREAIVGLIANHMIPPRIYHQDNSLREVIRVSQTARCDLLTHLAMADTRGRVAVDLEDRETAVLYWEEYCFEQGCYKQPYKFTSDHARVEYFRHKDRSPSYEAHDDTKTEVILMAGLPGAGKSYWIANHGQGWPIVSLDVLRKELGILPTGPQDVVVNAARKQAREYLRRQQPFIWDATSLNRKLRKPTIGLFMDYGARVKVVYVEVPPETLYRQNRERPAVVPDEAYERMLGHWDIPDLTEVHQISYVLG